MTAGARGGARGARPAARPAGFVVVQIALALTSLVGSIGRALVPVDGNSRRCRWTVLNSGSHRIEGPLLVEGEVSPMFALRVVSPRGRGRRHGAACRHGGTRAAARGGCPFRRRGVDSAVFEISGILGVGVSAASWSPAPRAVRVEPLASRVEYVAGKLRRRRSCPPASQGPGRNPTGARVPARVHGHNPQRAHSSASNSPTATTSPGPATCYTDPACNSPTPHPRSTPARDDQPVGCAACGTATECRVCNFTLRDLSRTRQMGAPHYCAPGTSTLRTAPYKQAG